MKDKHILEKLKTFTKNSIKDLKDDILEDFLEDESSKEIKTNLKGSLESSLGSSLGSILETSLEGKEGKEGKLSKPASDFRSEGGNGDTEDRILKISDLIFQDSNDFFFLTSYKNLTFIERKNAIENILELLAENSGPGYLNTLDLTKYHFINLMLPCFISLDAIEHQKAKEVSPMDIYKWLYNILTLNLYMMSLDTLSSLKTFSFTDFEKTVLNDLEEDLKTDFENLSKILYGKLDPTIRQHLQKRGLSIVQNIHTGFDTEYQSNDLLSNNLLSVQLAITTKTFLKIPCRNSFSISSFNVDTNTTHQAPRVSTLFNFKKIEKSVQKCIDFIRELKFGSYDSLMFTLSSKLKTIKAVNYFEKQDLITFSLPSTNIQPFISYTNIFTFKEIVDQSNRIGIPFLEESYSKLLELIKTISQQVLKIEVELDEKGPKIIYDFETYVDSLKVDVNENKQLPVITYTPESSKLSELSKNQNTFNSLKANTNTNANTKGKNKEETVETLENLESVKMVDSKFVKKLSRQMISIENSIKEDPKEDSKGILNISVTRMKINYFIAHLTQADLSILSDFNSIKEELSIVNGSFVTLGKPFYYALSNIHIRDTMLLAPAGSKSLQAIGKLYQEAFNKIDISLEDLQDMATFLSREREKFEEYALRDALVALIHASWMEEFNFNLGGTGVPISLSSIGRKFVKFTWEKDNYPGYQLNPLYLIGDSSASLTPIGINMLKEIGLILSFYTANYKGGRNECFMYGIDKDTHWYDYDLISAYTSVMSRAGHPDYSKFKRVTETELDSMTKEEILYSYLIMNADFEFPDVKFPSIPCYVDEVSTVYPLKGSCILTGAEYLLAISQNCKLKIHEIFCIPFGSAINSEGEVKRPFNKIIKIIQEKRRQYPKGTINNLMYKEIGNSMYGSVVRGMSNKKKFDIKSGSTRRVEGDDITNPLIASWTTAFIRSIIGECLHSISLKKGKIVSVTTDGFITNISDLEFLLKDNFLMGEFKRIRQTLSTDDTGLEIKSDGKGVIAWSTRGQMGIDSKIVAMTGFQRQIYPDRNILKDLLIDTMKSKTKTIEFIQSRLRSASDIYKKGGHVTMVYRDQLFRMHYDNRRFIIDDDEVEDTKILASEKLLDSRPFHSIEEARNLRFISKIDKTTLYSHTTSLRSNSRYLNYEELAIRNFLKGLLSQPPLFNLNRSKLKSYSGIIQFIQGYRSDFKISESSISKLKLRQIKLKAVPKHKLNAEFIQYVLEEFPDFDTKSFFRNKS